jgi:two-component system sensor histidine kinase DctS
MHKFNLTATAVAGRPRRWRRALLWGALVGLLLVAQTLLVWLTLDYENNRAQEQVDAAAASAIGDLRQALGSDLQELQALTWNNPPVPQWRADAAALLRVRRELARVERRGADLRVEAAVNSPHQTAIFTQIPRDRMEFETQLACANARRQAGPSYSRSYFVPMTGGMGTEVVDVCLPMQAAGETTGYLVGTLSLTQLLNTAVPGDVTRNHELSFVEGDGTRLARAGLPRGTGIFRSDRVLDLPGLTLQLRVDSGKGRARLIPNLTIALVLTLTLALGAVVVLLARDVRRRAEAEAALAEALAVRKAMEDSLVTGLRARDLQGRITYVNPAFCKMVGFSPHELIGQSPPPYWPPERVDEYTARQQVRLSAGTTPPAEGQESVFMRKNGERFSVMIFEAPLVDGHGRHTGWMSTALDVSAQRRVEEISRQQQERLQATARLATVGEMASLLSHELNQPLSAIASYATGSLNLMNDPRQADTAETYALLRQAAQRIAEQAERAGRVIKSVHDFVRRREQAREVIRVDDLIESVLPLVRLQARKSGARIELDLPSPLPRVECDRTMLEQVLLNLTRNGIQAMDATPLPKRELLIRVRQAHERWVTFSIIDHGCGVAPDVAQRLFTPFFTTRAEGMGLGLSLCRTVIEQHGGALDFDNLPAPPGSPERTEGAEFRFTLPAAPVGKAGPKARAEQRTS